MIDDKELRDYFISILTRGSKNNTYKFALARFLLEHSQKYDLAYIENKKKNNQNEVVDFQDIANKFLKYYWYQECKYRIKQNYNDKKPPSVVVVIREVFGEGYIPNWGGINPKQRIRAEEKIREKVFGTGYKSQVVPRFQKLKGQQDRHPFYDYDIQNGRLEIKPEALEFFHLNNKVLMKAVFLEWCKFLEKINTLPRLIAKVQSAVVKRKSLAHYRKIFRDQKDCFYCHRSLDERLTHVDHFIPWAYIFGDEVWNLVLACQQCNLTKSDFLPPLEFRDDLIKRNNDQQDEIKQLKDSLLRLNAENKWKAEIIHHYDNCKDYGFNVIPLP